MTVFRISEVAEQMKPYILDYVAKAVAAGEIYAPSPHALTSPHHTGSAIQTKDDNQVANGLLQWYTDVTTGYTESYLDTGAVGTGIANQHIYVHNDGYDGVNIELFAAAAVGDAEISLQINAYDILTVKDTQIIAYQDLRIAKGLFVGSYATDPGDGNVVYTGALQSYKGGTPYTGYIYIPLTTPLTSTSWDGDSYSTTAKTLIDLSGVFNVPPNVKAVYAHVYLRDSGSDGVTTWVGVILDSSGTADVGQTVSCNGITNDAWMRSAVIIPCDANGDIYYQLVATGTLTLDIYIKIWGYFI